MLSTLLTIVISGLFSLIIYRAGYKTGQNDLILYLKSNDKKSDKNPISPGCDKPNSIPAGWPIKYTKIHIKKE